MEWEEELYYNCRDPSFICECYDECPEPGDTDSFREEASDSFREDGVSEASLSSGGKASEVWDDWTDGAPSNSITPRRAPAVAKEWGDCGASTAAWTSIPPSSPLADVTLADGGRAFDCSACCLPLKPPIFQVRHSRPNQYTSCIM
jgi:hypothetical protein